MKWLRFGQELEKIDIPKYRGNYIQYNAPWPRKVTLELNFQELKLAIEEFTGEEIHFRAR